MRNKEEGFKVKTLGFTLIELLVVISIIGILAGLTLTGFSAARKNARDTQRKSDLAQYKAALEAYAANNGGKYPEGNGASMNNNSIFKDEGDIIPNYLPAKIADPLEGRAACDGSLCTYYYRPNPSRPVFEYVLYALLETGGVWELCSNGKAGRVKTGEYTINYTCDL